MATTITYIDPESVTMTKSPDLLRVNGSDYAGAKQVKGTGLDLDTPDTPFAFPIIQDSNLSDTQESSTLSSEGATNYTLDGNITTTMQITSLQADGETIVKAKSMRGLYYQVVKKINDTPLGGAYYFLVIPIAKAITSINLTGLNPTTVFDFGVNKTEVDTEVNFSEYDSIFPNIDFSLSTTPETMTAGDWYYIFKVTV